MTSVELTNDLGKQTITGTIKYCRPVAIWSYDVENDTCVICQSQLTALCIECSTKTSVDVNKCNVAKGKCGHAFHYHCISAWSKKGPQTCPVDNTPWNYVSDDLNKQPEWNRLITNKK